MADSFSIHRAATIIRLLVLAAVLAVAPPVTAGGPADNISFSDLKELYKHKNIPEPLSTKVSHLMTVPFVSNEAAGEVAFNRSPLLGDFIRVVHWNIERGLEFNAIAAIFDRNVEIADYLDKKEFPEDSEKRRRFLEQAELLRNADVIVLNEVDWGLKRSDYRNVAEDLARKLKMNYAFGVQFIELSPIQFEEEFTAVDPQQKEILELIKVDPERYKGLHGLAILSRFPLENVRLVPFKTQPYDWYSSEKNGFDLVEMGKRQVSKAVFLEKALKEIRRGGRTTLYADISDPRFPSGKVTIAATHLENRTKPKNRVKQLKELLEEIKGLEHPVIVAGDMNTSTQDLTPTSLRRELVKRFGNASYWLKKGASYLLGFGLVEDTVMSGLSFGRKHSDPTVKDIPFVSPNPERKFFSTLEDFRFLDGGKFDFRGEPARSWKNRGSTLSNSNERNGKGFVTTYSVHRPLLFIGKLKLDWIFVRPKTIEDAETGGRFESFPPYFGRTLDEVNDLVEDGISDHRPISVDLPLIDPKLEDARDL